MCFHLRCIPHSSGNHHGSQHSLMRALFGTRVHCEPVFLADFLQDLPPPPPPKDKEDPSAAPKASSSSSVPASSSATASGPAGSAGGHAHPESAHAPPPPAAPLVAEPLDDDEVEKAWAELENKRNEWAFKPPPGGADISFIVRGGLWTASVKKSGPDCCMASAHKGAPTAFSKKYAGRAMFSASFKEHGEPNSVLMCTEWCHKMQYFYDAYLGQADADYIFRSAT